MNTTNHSLIRVGVVVLGGKTANKVRVISGLEFGRLRCGMWLIDFADVLVVVLLLLLQ